MKEFFRIKKKLKMGKILFLWVLLPVLFPHFVFSEQNSPSKVSEFHLSGDSPPEKKTWWSGDKFPSQLSIIFPSEHLMERFFHQTQKGWQIQG